MKKIVLFKMLLCMTLIAMLIGCPAEPEVIPTEEVVITTSCANLEKEIAKIKDFSKIYVFKITDEEITWQSEIVRFVLNKKSKLYYKFDLSNIKELPEEKNLFLDCKKLLAVDLSGIISQGIFASSFEGCVNLTDVVLSDEINSIGGWAFKNCNSLKNINCPSRLMAIWGQAFSGCSSLERIHISKKVWIIEEKAFDGCNKLKTITVDPENTHFEVKDGILYFKDDNSVVFDTNK